MDDKIFLQYHYEQYYITATTREFIKPPKPSYGEEIRFDPSLTKSYKVGVLSYFPISTYQYLNTQSSPIQIMRNHQIWNYINSFSIN